MYKAIRVLAVLLLSTFAIQAIAQNNLEITGKLANNSFSEVVFEAPLEQKDLKTISINDMGEFNASLKIEKENFYFLRFDDYTKILLILKPGEKINVVADMSNLEAAQITGSENTELKAQISDGIIEFDKKVEEYQKKIEKEKDEYLRKEILKNKGSLTAILFLEGFDMEKDAALYKEVLDELHKKYPDNAFVNEYYSKFNAKGKLAIGQPAPEIALPDKDGKEIKLSSLKGKVVLIDFWASWCSPCIREAPNVVKAYNEFKDKGFEILGVSLDQKRDSWLAAIEKHDLDWLHISDLQGWKCAASQEYGVEGIPFTVLVDKKGNILAKNLRGEELHAKLAKIFK